MANPIQEAPWKISFIPAGNGPYAVKVKLFDLLFNSSNANAAWYLTDGAGLNLPHDIFLFDPAAYATSGGGAINPGALRDTRQNHGIFLTKITYDARAVATWVSDPSYAALVNSTDVHNGDRGYYVYDTTSALPPLETDYTTIANKTYYDTSLASVMFTDLLDPLSPYDTLTNPYMCYVSSATLGISGLSASTTSALIVSSPDLALQATIPGSSLQPYTRICLRADTSNSEIISILQFFTRYGINNDENPISGTQVADLLDVTKNTHLLDIEIWVRCSFFTDYVTPSSFEQNLAAGSQVAHENLILGRGDFSRFTREISPNEIIPYIPMTPPRNDVSGITLVANAGPFPVPPVTGTYDSPTTVSNTPFGWVNPELQSGAITGGLVAVPLKGNAYVSGRIFSPTIDELWIYIKKLVDGQGTGAVSSTLTEPTISLPGGHIGDPISADGTSYVAAPSSISYSVDTTIQSIVNAILPSSYANYVPTSNPTPRTNPYSLRELESIVDNLQYNSRTAVGFFAANAVSTGNINTSIGTVYQLHSSYSPASPTVWQWSVANTYNAAESAVNYGAALPQATNYDRTANFIAGDSYLSADGKWHYLFDHVRIPVLAETY